jgi:hypothetical protein
VGLLARRFFEARRAAAGFFVDAGCPVRRAEKWGEIPVDFGPEQGI